MILCSRRLAKALEVRMKPK
ncbi:hypothetical protein CJF31_00009204 [Rutstroemia sp. NJR-2017a BVV2]|nr:hypothetical protein CJF31_00009204 [Rutstroemia sp. NJR-2017a BVV2]